MSADQKKQTQLLDLLIQNELVKAAIIIDEFGRAKGRRGRARCLRLGDEDVQSTLLMNTNNKKGSRESVYIAAAGGADFLIVVFDEQVSFDSLKLQIDEAIGEVGLPVSD